MVAQGGPAPQIFEDSIVRYLLCSNGDNVDDFQCDSLTKATLKEVRSVSVHTLQCSK